MTEQLGPILPVHKEIQIAYLQSACLLPGGKTETSLNTTKVPGLKMHWVKGEGLLVDIKGVQSLIPSTNVKIVIFSK